jgi:hypothetical protein
MAHPGCVGVSQFVNKNDGGFPFQSPIEVKFP